jgi:poly(A) polymerase
MSDMLEKILLKVSRRLKIPVWWVGGPVRDALLKRPWVDGDVACHDAQRMAKALSRTLSAKLITLDERYKIYRVILPAAGTTLDVAELQGKTIEEDLGRRDFSINAMARLVGSSTLIDPWKGVADLRKKKIRALSQKVLKDDPIRRLRAFRFSAQLNFSIDPQTLRWIHKGSLQGIAAERIREELLKLLSSTRAGETLAAMDKAGVLIEIFEDLEACRRTARSYYGTGGVLTHSLNTVRNLEWLLERLPIIPTINATACADYLNLSIGGYPRRAWLKLGALLHDIGKPATAQKIKGRLRFFGHEEVGADRVGPLAIRLRLSRQETQLVRLWVKHHMRLGGLAAAADVTTKAFFRYFRDLQGEGLGMVLVSLADHFDYLARARWGKNTDAVEKMARAMISMYFEKNAVLKLPQLINGHDVMRALKLAPSPVIGVLLKSLEEAQLDGRIRTRAQALRHLPVLFRQMDSPSVDCP